MGLADVLRDKGADLAGKAVQMLFADERRAQQLASLVGAVQQGRKAIDEAQEKVLRNMGVASSGDMKAAGKRLAQLRKSARALDEKLGALQRKLGSDGR